MKISLHTDFTATALCGAVAEATYRLEDWIASDGGALISVNNHKNLTIPVIQCHGKNWTLGLITVTCKNRSEIKLVCIMDTACNGTHGILVFRQMKTTFTFKIEGINIMKLCIEII